MALGMVIGSIATGGTVFAVIIFSAKAILSSPVLMSAIEGLVNSWPPQAREALLLAGKVAEEASDGVSSESKPPRTP